MQMFADDTFTYFSECHNTTSWIDHVVRTQSAHDLIEDINVHYNYISSDHHPISFTVKLQSTLTGADDSENLRRAKTVKWDRMSEAEISQYKPNTELTLSDIYNDHSLI